MKEVLFGQDAEAAGTADGVTGTVEIAGHHGEAVDVEVDMTTFESAESRRDGQFQGRIMETDEFPTATFALTEPIDARVGPGRRRRSHGRGHRRAHAARRHPEVTVDLDGRAERGDLRRERRDPDHFADYEIPDPSGGPASVGSDGELELLLVFSR